MSTPFTANELAYVTSQRLGRLATIDATGQPYVVPVGFRYNTELATIDIGGHNMGKSHKYRTIQQDGRVAFVIDDVVPPWQPRGIEIRGHAQVFANGGKAINPSFDEEFIRITLTHIVSWGIDTDVFHRQSRDVVPHTAPTPQEEPREA